MISSSEVRNNIKLAFRDDVLNEYGAFWLTEDMVQDGKALIPLKVISGSNDEWYLELQVFEEATAPEWYHWIMEKYEDGLLVDAAGSMDTALTRAMNKNYELGSDAFWTVLEKAVVSTFSLAYNPSEVYAGMQVEEELGLIVEKQWPEENQELVAADIRLF